MVPIIMHLIVPLLLLTSCNLLAADFYTKDCANNGDGTAQSCAVSPGATGAWAGDATFSTVAFGTDS